MIIILGENDIQIQKAIATCIQLACFVQLFLPCVLSERQDLGSVIVRHVLTHGKKRDSADDNSR